ncbi:MAG: glycine cleavage system aminomethyltransferase GcvT [Euryarchaeota archaeon]|nr:glycine cleavage system aminomethyltransferase GcvT [Euryarchaeota archaeon]
MSAAESATEPGLLKGPLHDLHARLGARFVGFGGFEMPVQYSSIKEEHEAVRTHVGLFDVSHMSNLRIEGPGAEALLSRTTVSDAAKLKVGRGVYTAVLRDDGTILDDTIFYRMADDSFYLVPNAGLNEAVRAALEAHADDVEGDVTVTDVSRATCIFALQGPDAPAVLKAAGADVPDTPPFRIHEAQVDGAVCQVATTGYTGETGYELFVSEERGPEVFEALLDAGKVHGIEPVGLGARDTLRLEMGFALAGNEFEGGRTPLEAGLGWAVKWDHDFVGKEALVRQKETDDHDRLVGLELSGRGIARHGYAVLDGSGQQVGIVTSGTLSPSLDTAIALAYVRPGQAAPGTEVAVDVRGRPVAATVAKTPFLKRS